MNTILLLAALSSAPAEPACYTLEQAMTDTRANGGRVIGIVDDIRAVGADQFLIISMRGMITLGAVNEGCMVYEPVQLMYADDETPA